MASNDPTDNEQDVPLEGEAALPLYLSTILNNVNALTRQIAVLRQAFVDRERLVSELDFLRKREE